MTGLEWTTDPVLLVLYALAVYRLTRLLVADVITEPARRWVNRHAYGEEGSTEVRYSAGWRFVDELITCPWCVSVWLAAGWAALACLLPLSVSALLAFVLAASALAGLLSSRE